MYGIDPDVTHLWTPKRWRLSPEGRDEAIDAVWPGDKAIKDPTVKEVFQKAAVKIYADHADLPDRIKEGAPVVEIGPLLEKFSIRLGRARATYEAQLKLARERLEKEREAVEADATLTDPERIAKLEDLNQEAEEKNIARGNSVYDEALILEVVRSVVIKKTEDKIPLPIGWEYALFQDLLDLSAYSKREIESFTSARDSGQG